MTELVACSYRLLRSLLLERDKEPSVPCLPPPNQPRSPETKPFDWDGQEAVPGRLIGKVQGWNRYWNLLTTWARLPFGPHKRLLAPLQENSEERSLTGWKRRKRRKSDCFVGAETRISYGLEYMLMMRLSNQGEVRLPLTATLIPTILSTTRFDQIIILNNSFSSFLTVNHKWKCK